MEFWKLYNIISARRWMILGLLAITLVTVAIAKKAVDEQTFHSAAAIVLPDNLAMSPQGFFQKNAQGLLSPTYGRFDRMAQFTTNLRNTSFDEALRLAGETSVQQKQAVAKAFINDLPLGEQTSPLQAAIGPLPPDQPKRQLRSLIEPGNKDRYLEDDLNKFLNIKLYHHAPGDPAIDPRLLDDTDFWASRPQLFNPMTPGDRDVQEQLRGKFAAAPIVDEDINTTPGATTQSNVTTDFLKITSQAQDPSLAQQLSNLTAAAFINDYDNEGNQDQRASADSVTRERVEAQAKLTAARRKIVDFQSSHQLVDVGSDVDADLKNLQGLKTQYAQAQVQFQVAQRSAATYSQLAKSEGASRTVNLAPAARPEVKTLQTQVDDQQQVLDTLRGEYTDLNPKVIKAAANLAATKKELATLLSQPYQDSTPNAQYQTLLAQADTARATAAQAQQTMTSLSAQIAQQQAQNRTLPAAQNILVGLKENELSAEADMKTANDDYAEMQMNKQRLNHGHIALTAAATLQEDANGPALPLLLLYAAFLSLVIGIAAAVGLDYLDFSVQTIPDAEKLLGMPVSAVIPAMTSGDGRHNTRLVVTDPLSPIAESYRLLRTDLLFTAEQQPFKSLMAATAKPGQGATTTICNLAVSLAAVGKRVILIDADLRRPKLHDFFNVSNAVGLTSLLRDECELEEALKVTDIDNLLVLPSGPMPLNPSELLASQKMRALHERLKPHTDFVLVDTPSAMAFSDSSIMASYLDAVMIVVRAQETPRGSEIQLKNLLNKARANLVGVVLNGVKPKLVDSYVYHAAYYPQIAPNTTRVLPPPPPSAPNGNALGTGGANGNGSRALKSKTLEGDDFATVIAGPPKDAPAQDVESTAIMDDIVTVTPQGKKRFNLRKMFGTDDQE